MDAIFQLLADRGHWIDPGDGVPQLAHALQSAALARDACAGDHLIVASLLHDIGHMLEGIGCEHHEIVGATWLAHTFPPSITEPIRLHADAKRYLFTTDPHFADSLSPASLNSLDFQGGRMTPAELATFKSNPHCSTALRLRHYDDHAKDPTKTTPPLDSWRPLLQRTREQ